ncbi:hypothetical protein NFH98_20770 [Halomonas sp. H33-56]|uniref:hypothetical protein n=1 Tax=Halomonas sp. H33-56 TaxID=2950873 RepID=UPI0032DE7722
MTHPRKLIRDKIVERLTGNTDAGLRVYGSRVLPYWNGRQGLEAAMPAILVYTLREPVEIFSQAPREYRRTVQVAVQAMVMGEDVDDPLDDLARQIELCLFDDDTLDGTAAELVLLETEIVFTDEGEREMGAARLAWEATYYDEIEPVLEDYLATVQAEWDVAHPDGDIEAVDTITPEQE